MTMEDTTNKRADAHNQRAAQPLAIAGLTHDGADVAVGHAPVFSTSGNASVGCSGNGSHETAISFARPSPVRKRPSAYSRRVRSGSDAPSGNGHWMPPTASIAS